MSTTGATTGGVPGDEKTLLLDWMARQNDISAAVMLRAISATHLVKERRGIWPDDPARARDPYWLRTALGSWDPDPDYFFHWLRDIGARHRCLAACDRRGSLRRGGAFPFQGVCRVQPLSQSS